MYCRPFDDQTHIRVRGEAEAFVRILGEVETGVITLLSSDLLILEVGMIKGWIKRERVRGYLKLCSEHVLARDGIRVLAEKLERACGLGGRDAYHVSSACYGRADYFLTCDDRILKRKKCVKYVAEKEGFKITLLNPVEFMEQTLGRRFS